MKIISTNIAEPVTFIWNGREETTGIYKKPVEQPIYLTRNDVANDVISNRLNHGGYFKACYVFSVEQYPHWQNRYPDLDWSWGMFGENLTLENFNEKNVMLGDIYEVGDAIVQVAQYREPCYKLGHKFGTQHIIREFIEHGFGGTYLSILQEGRVQRGDHFQLIERPQETLSVHALFHLVHAKAKDPEQLKIVSSSPFLPYKKRVLFQKLLSEMS